MAYQPLEELLPKANGSIYRLIRLASKRASELADNKPNLIEAPMAQKLTTTALREIADGKVVLKDVAGLFDGKDKTTKNDKSKKSQAQQEESLRS